MNESKKQKLFTPLQESDIVFNEVYSGEYAIRGYSITDELTPDEINEHNYIELCEIANNQFGFFMEHKKLSGFCIVDWRVIFTKLFDYIESKANQIADNEELMKFYIDYEDISAQELYKRLGLQY